VFAWLRLRGRCRTCHLPISIEYPLIELAVGVVFLVVYFTEFAIAGSNLPGTGLQPLSSGLVWMSVTPVLATRVFIYLFVLSGSIAAALIAARRVETPLALFGWVLLVILVGELAKPAAVVVPWWPASSSDALTHLDALLSVGLGGLAGLIAAALTLVLLQRATGQVAWYGTLACVGALVGWQWLAAATACILLVAWAGDRVLRGPLSRWAASRGIGSPSSVSPSSAGLGSVSPSSGSLWTRAGASVDPVVWAWLGLLIFRANWKSLDGVLGGGDLTSPASWLAVVCEALLALLMAWLIGLAARAVQCPCVADAQSFPAGDAEIAQSKPASESGAVFPP
jgi:prepilin signal peptidase PulO-like enzyme (type II secretory pathway)